MTLHRSLAWLATLWLPIAAQAANIDLSTIPPRDSVQLTIYNSEDLTLVRETRTIAVKKGLNPLQFSWANTLIDPTSVSLRFLAHDDKLDLLDTTYPHDKRQMLYWVVRSAHEGDVTIEVTYFTSGISWSADYVCIANPAETATSFDGYVKITNNSGEDYAGASVRMVVGTINLVEDIRDLATRGLIPESAMEWSQRGDERLRDLDEEARPQVMDRLGGKMGRGGRLPVLSGGGAGNDEKEIEKEGLSEYFIYTVPGTETIANGWSKRMRLFVGREVPLRIQYRYRPEEYGDELVRMFLLRNDKASKLGETPLPDGELRLYRDNGRDGLSLLATQWNKYVPIGQEIELNLGPDPEVVHELIAMASRRDSFWFQRNGADLFFNPADGHRIELDDVVVGWDEHTRYVERIRNYRDKPIDVEIRRSFYWGQYFFRSRLDPKLHDYETVQFSATVPAGEKRELAYELVTRMGHKADQQNVTLEPAD
jgi:hypothetical protein